MLKNIRGAGKLGCLIWIVILGAGAYVGFKYLESRWNYLSMREQLSEVAKFAAALRPFDEDIVKKEVIKRGTSLGITIYPEDIKAKEEEGEITIDVYWEVPLEFPGYTYTQDFSLTVSYRRGGL